jgi:hypothetical protein
MSSCFASAFRACQRDTHNFFFVLLPARFIEEKGGETGSLHFPDAAGSSARVNVTSARIAASFSLGGPQDGPRCSSDIRHVVSPCHISWVSFVTAMTGHCLTKRDEEM